MTHAFKEPTAKGDLETRGIIRREVARDNWREFLRSPKINDLGRSSQCFARVEGTGAKGARPSFLRWLKGGATYFHSRKKAEMRGQSLADTVVAKRHGVTVSKKRRRGGKN